MSDKDFDRLNRAGMKINVRKGGRKIIEQKPENKESPPQTEKTKSTK